MGVFGMPMIECHGCLKKVDAKEVRWILHLGGSVSRTEEGFLAIQHAELDNAEPGAVPYCAQCRANMMNEESE
jgi:hypothetical protein